MKWIENCLEEHVDEQSKLLISEGCAKEIVVMGPQATERYSAMQLIDQRVVGLYDPTQGENKHVWKVPSFVKREESQP